QDGRLGRNRTRKPTAFPNCQGLTIWKCGRFSCSVSTQATVLGSSSTAVLSARAKGVFDVEVGPQRGVPRSGHWPFRSPTLPLIAPSDTGPDRRESWSSPPAAVPAHA